MRHSSEASLDATCAVVAKDRGSLQVCGTSSNGFLCEQYTCSIQMLVPLVAWGGRGITDEEERKT